MSAPRLEIRLDHLTDNATLLVDRLATRGISVCGVTKAALGDPRVAMALVNAGVASLGDARVENVERLRAAGVSCEVVLVRSPMISQCERVVACVDVSLNSEIDVIAALSEAALAVGRCHGVILMVELGDRREGLMPGDLHAAVRQVRARDGVVLRGIGTNLACQSGVIPDASNMGELSNLAASVETVFGTRLEIVSGGTSANLDWALDPDVVIGRINHLRLGESILLGREPTRRAPLEGLHLDAFELIGEVIESKIKPSRPRGRVGETAFADRGDGGDSGDPDDDNLVGGEVTSRRVIVALGRQDVDPRGLTPPEGYLILGSSSDHLVMEAIGTAPAIGSELRFDVDYRALLGSATSPFVGVEYRDDRDPLVGLAGSDVVSV